MRTSNNSSNSINSLTSFGIPHSRSRLQMTPQPQPYEYVTCDDLDQAEKAMLLKSLDCEDAIMNMRKKPRDVVIGNQVLPKKHYLPSRLCVKYAALMCHFRSRSMRQDSVSSSPSHNSASYLSTIKSIIKDTIWLLAIVLALVVSLRTAEIIFPGFNIEYKVLSIGPIGTLYDWLMIPSIYRTEFGVNVPVSVMDGMQCLHQAAPLPIQGHSVTKIRGDTKLAIAMPFVERQCTQLLEALSLYVNYPPGEQVDFFLFFNRDEEALIKAGEHSFMNKANKLIMQISGAPGRVVYSDLTVAQDTYPLGTWYQLVHIIQYLDTAGYDAFMLSEPDVWPVREGWAGALLSHVNPMEDWWVRGSLWHGNIPMGWHLNGNMMYRLGDNGFYVFVCMSSGGGVDLAVHNSHRGFDTTASRYATILRRSDNLSHGLSVKFHVTSIIINLSETGCTDVDDVRKRYPHAFLVHSRLRYGSPKYCVDEGV